MFAQEFFIFFWENWTWPSLSSELSRLRLEMTKKRPSVSDFSFHSTDVGSNPITDNKVFFRKDPSMQTRGVHSVAGHGGLTAVQNHPMVMGSTPRRVRRHGSQLNWLPLKNRWKREDLYLKLDQQTLLPLDRSKHSQMKIMVLLGFNVAPLACRWQHWSRIQPAAFWSGRK